MSVIDEKSHDKSFDGQAEIASLTLKYEIDIKEVEDIGNQEIQAIKDLYIGMIEVERANPKPSKKIIRKLTAESYFKIQESVKNSMEKITGLAEIYGESVVKVCEEKNIPVPDSKTVDIEFIPSDLYSKDTVEDSYKKLSFADKCAWVVFFAVAPLGMAVIEDYFLVGLILIVGAMLYCPPMLRAVLRNFPWIHPISIICISNVLIQAGFIKLLIFP